MEVQFSPDLQAKLAHMASEMGRPEGDVVLDAVWGYVGEWEETRKRLDNSSGDSTGIRARLLAEQANLPPEILALHERSPKVVRSATSVGGAKPKRSLEEIAAIVKGAQEAFREANTECRDPLAELIAERRAEAARE